MSNIPPLPAEPVDAELASRPGAPWEREGASPHQAEAQQDAAAGWKHAMAREKRRMERQKRKQAALEEATVEAARALEKSARRMYYVGFFALPLVWLVALFYFHAEHKNPAANPAIKRYYRNSGFMLVLYTVVFVAWFVVFEVFADGKLKNINILYHSGISPNGF